jgi:hypothetical protein
MAMRLYLGGKMRNIPDFGFEFFDEAAMSLRALGYEVFNPAEGDRAAGFKHKGTAGTDAEMNSQGHTRASRMAVDMAWIAQRSEGMIAIENWPDSPGAKAEISFHHALSLPVWELNEFLRFGVQAPLVAPLVPVQVKDGRAQKGTAAEGVKDWLVTWHIPNDRIVVEVEFDTRALSREFADMIEDRLRGTNVR